jgi:hypothetical protein
VMFRSRPAIEQPAVPEDTIVDRCLEHAPA